MSRPLTQLQIGQRLVALRKKKKLPQVELAAHLKMSRSALAQVELGNHGVDATELHALSLILHFSLDALLAPDVAVESFQLEKL